MVIGWFPPDIVVEALPVGKGPRQLLLRQEAVHIELLHLPLHNCLSVTPHCAQKRKKTKKCVCVCE